MIERFLELPRNFNPGKISDPNKIKFEFQTFLIKIFFKADKIFLKSEHILGNLIEHKN